MVVVFANTYAIGAYHHWYCEFESRSGRNVYIYNIIINKGNNKITELRTILQRESQNSCDTVFQWLVADWWFYSGTTISSTNKTDCHDKTEILSRVALNTIKPNQTIHVGLFGWVPGEIKQLMLILM